MSLLADVKTFITDHEPHGELTGDAGEVTRSGYRLWITCPCGVTFERIAEPVGICISRQVFDQVSRALKADSQALGPRTLKNIAQPVDVFAIAPTDRGAGPGVTAPMPSPQAGGLLLHRARRGPARPLDDRRGAAAGENRQLDDASGVRSREPDLAASLSGARQGPPTHPLRRCSREVRRRRRAGR
jgi:hypothetical protein